MPERSLDQNDPNLDTRAALQRSITATLTYLMGRASVAELYGLQGYLSQLASRMTDVGGNTPQRADDSWDQELERRRQHGIAQQALAHQMAQYRQES